MGESRNAGKGKSTVEGVKTEPKQRSRKNGNMTGIERGKGVGRRRRNRNTGKNKFIVKQTYEEKV
jgi:hypothetical protein